MATRNSMPPRGASRAAWPSVILGKLDRLLCATCAGIVLTFTTLLILQVILRQMGQPLFWVEELCQYLVVYLCFFGSAIAWGRREHLAVEFVPEMLTPNGCKLLKKFVDLLVFSFAVWACYVSAEFAGFSMRKLSISLNIPVGYGYLGVPIGFGLIAIQTLIFQLPNSQHVKPQDCDPLMEEVGM